MRTPVHRVLLIAIALATGTGCAAVFRSSKSKVHVVSEPAGAEAKVKNSEPKQTPADLDVERKAPGIVITKQGYAEHRGSVRRRVSAPWLLLDLATCLFTFCIPLAIDAGTGAWLDVASVYSARLEPAVPASASAAASGGPPPPVASTTPATSATTADAASSMTESERKATARAAYVEGVGLQDKNDCAAALPKFEVAQKMFNAPTHLLHIAQCQAAIGKLVEAQETYETLVRTPLAKDAPDPFVKAQEEGKKELPALKPRIPTLRVQITPAPSSLKGLLVLVNGSPMPNELVGIARPVNPGKYKISAQASGQTAAPVEVDVAEGATKAVDLRLGK